MDGIGPRLVGTPKMQQAHEWAVANELTSNKNDLVNNCYLMVCLVPDEKLETWDKVVMEIPNE
jgi:hypothetical protein